MSKQSLRGLALLGLLLAATGIACGLTDGDGIPRNAVVVEVIANASARPWLQAAASDFNSSEPETAGGEPIYVDVRSVESGLAAVELAAGATQPALWVPDDPVWTNVAADQGAPAYQGNCLSIAQSPLVIAMWRPAAESLGWPGLPLGWLDIGSLAADPSAWAYYSGGDFGETLRLGHTHPGLSGSGSATLLAIVQAAESMTEAVDVANVEAPIVQASVSSFEGSVAWFSSDTNSLAATMSERGAAFLGAAVMYESDLLHHRGAADIVPIYPLEGTFVATHPACINDALPSETQAAAEQFRQYLVGEEAQRVAVGFGLRPVVDGEGLTDALAAEAGVDLTQPATIFGSPSVATIYAVQSLWQSARKDVNLVMLLDTSGSMRGDKLSAMKAAATQFVDQMGDDDYISVLGFATEPFPLVIHQRVGDAREDIKRQIARLEAGGDTTLFDAIGDGATLIADTQQPDTSNALVVLTDGKDTRSYRYDFNDALVNRAAANSTTIFTIAYGSDADEETLFQLARQANGNFFLGDEASIAAIYDELSAAFGGNVGVGR